jgi:hypothetical protein
VAFVVVVAAISSEELNAQSWVAVAVTVALCVYVIRRERRRRRD